MYDRDEELLSIINACLQGNEEAWHSFVNHYGKIVRGCLLRFFRGDPETVDDVTQRVFIKLWKAGLRDFRGTNRYQFLSYLKMISTNEARTYYRSMGQRHEVSGSHDFPSESHQDILTEIASEAPNPEEAALANSRIEILSNHVHELSLEHQQLFLMKLKGFKDREIAQILGIPDGTVASTYSRTVERLKKALRKS